MKMKKALTAVLTVLSISALLTGTLPVWAAETKAPSGTEASMETEAKDGTEAPTEAQSGTESTSERDTQPSSQDSALKDGVYSAKFDTDSSMFHVNEANEGRGTLTVRDGEMTIHISLVSKSIRKLFAGTAEDAGKDGAELLEPTTDTVTYSDGMSEEVYGFDIPVPALEEEFDVALIGKKGKWYDHKVTVSDPQPETGGSTGVMAADLNLKDGSYTAEVVLEGGSGRAGVESPAQIEIKDGKALAVITWSSSNYDYMIVDGEKYTMLDTKGNSTFEIPVLGFDYPMPVIADTVAMSEPHEIEYTLQFDSASIRETDKEAGK